MEEKILNQYIVYLQVIQYCMSNISQLKGAGTGRKQTEMPWDF